MALSKQYYKSQKLSQIFHPRWCVILFGDECKWNGEIWWMIWQCQIGWHIILDVNLGYLLGCAVSLSSKMQWTDCYIFQITSFQKSQIN